MSPKWAKKAHFGDISYNVFNRRKSSYLILKPLNFTISLLIMLIISQDLGTYAVRSIQYKISFFLLESLF